MEKNNRINTTIRNFFTALAIFLTISFLLTLVFTLMRVFNSLISNYAVSFADSIYYLGFMFKMVFIFFGLIVLLLSFALLQRFRIKH